jgi:hypothetical protein
MNAVTPARASEGPDASRLWRDATAPAARSGERSEPLPCHSINNGDEVAGTSTKFRQQADLQNANASYQAKAGYALQSNLAGFIEKAGIEHVLEWTLTFEKKVYDYEEAQRAFHSLTRRVLPKHFPGPWWRVIERHADGAWHFHLLVQVPFDVRAGFRFDSFEAAKRRAKTRGQDGVYRMLMREAAPPDHPIRALWKAIGQDLWGKPAHAKGRRRGRLRAGKRAAPLRLRRYKFGRFQLCPIRTCGKAMGRYLAGYLAKSYAARKPSEKRYRLYGCSRVASKARIANAHFSWVSPRAKEWRQKVALVAHRFGCRDLDALNHRFGHRWAYKFRDVIGKLVLLDHPDNVKRDNPGYREFEKSVKNHNGLIFHTIGRYFRV